MSAYRPLVNETPEQELRELRAENSALRQESLRALRDSWVAQGRGSDAHMRLVAVVTLNVYAVITWLIWRLW